MEIDTNISCFAGFSAIRVHKNITLEFSKGFVASLQFLFSAV